MDKITAGTETWDWLGGAVLSIFGISFGHVLFGFFAAVSEGILTLFVLVGFKTRLASLFIMLYREQPILDLPYRIITKLIKRGY